MQQQAQEKQMEERRKDKGLQTNEYCKVEADSRVQVAEINNEAKLASDNLKKEQKINLEAVKGSVQEQLNMSQEKLITNFYL